MKILLTGAFGNIGQSTLAALLERGHQVRCFDLHTAANEKSAARWQGQIEPLWGDLRSPDDTGRAVAGQDAVVHLAFVIPTLSATGVSSEAQPDWAREINVGGTRNLIEAACRQERAPRFVFASSLHVYGKTQHLPPPRTALETPHPVEHYARHKIEAEELVRASGLRWSILRLAAAMPVRLILDRGMFDVPLENRMEFVHTRDAGAAFARAVDHPAVWCKTLLIGGGARCQYYYREIMGQVLDAAGIGSLPERAFAREPFATDWLDTRESQALLGYQQRTLSDYADDLRRALGGLRSLVVAFRPVVRQWLLAHSPYYHTR